MEPLCVKLESPAPFRSAFGHSCPSFLCRCRLIPDMDPEVSTIKVFPLPRPCHGSCSSISLWKLLGTKPRSSLKVLYASVNFSTQFSWRICRSAASIDAALSTWKFFWTFFMRQSSAMACAIVDKDAKWKQVCFGHKLLQTIQLEADWKTRLASTSFPQGQITRGSVGLSTNRVWTSWPIRTVVGQMATCSHADVASGQLPSVQFVPFPRMARPEKTSLPGVSTVSMTSPMSLRCNVKVPCWSEVLWYTWDFVETVTFKPIAGFKSHSRMIPFAGTRSLRSLYSLQIELNHGESNMGTRQERSIVTSFQMALACLAKLLPTALKEWFRKKEKNIQIVWSCKLCPM